MININELSLNTKSMFQIIDITNLVQNSIEKSKIKKGIVTITTKHTTSSIRINESEPLLLKDIENFFNEIVKESDYLHDDLKKRKNCPKNEPKNARSHLKALLMGTSETLPINNNKLSLGKFQKIFFIELDGPRTRSFTISILGE